MSKLDGFFSIEKIEYPLLVSILFGIILKVTELFLKISIVEPVYWIVMFLGFLLGNIYKINKIQASNNTIKSKKK